MTFTTVTWRDPLLIMYQSTVLLRKKDSIFVQMVLLIYVCVILTNDLFQSCK